MDAEPERDMAVDGAVELELVGVIERGSGSWLAAGKVTSVCSPARTGQPLTLRCP